MASIPLLGRLSSPPSLRRFFNVEIEDNFSVFRFVHYFDLMQYCSINRTLNSMFKCSHGALAVPREWSKSRAKSSRRPDKNMITKWKIITSSWLLFNTNRGKRDSILFCSSSTSFYFFSVCSRFTIVHWLRPLHTACMFRTWISQPIRMRLQPIVAVL